MLHRTVMVGGTLTVVAFGAVGPGAMPSRAASGTHCSFSAAQPTSIPVSPTRAAGGEAHSGLVSPGGGMLLQLSQMMEVPEEELLHIMGQRIVYRA